MAAPTPTDTSTIGEDVNLVVTAQANDGEGSSEVNVCVTINPPNVGDRTPSHIVCVVDVSGSMSNVAEAKDADGNVENHGLTILDITKHAVKTIIHTLGDDDYFSLVSYSTTAKIECQKVEMTEDGKKTADGILEKLRPTGQTNIWDGLHTGLELVRDLFETDPSKQASILLLTDGLPNVRPPRGETTMLKLYQDQHPHIKCTINTFGFGYRLDSPLLRDLATTGHGTYAFIPESSMTGTIFVNMLSNLLSCVGTNIELSLEPMNGASITQVYGGFPTTNAQWGSKVEIGSLTFGQSRDLVFTMDCPNMGENATFLAVTADYLPRGTNNPVRLTAELDTVSQVAEIQVQKYRLVFADTVRTAMTTSTTAPTQYNQSSVIEDKLSEAQAMTASLADEIASSDVATDERIVALLEDLTGQVAEAFSQSQYLMKWGRHYLPSLWRAHMQQQCNNFKDPGVQVYGGDLFKGIQTEADAIFIGLPPPKPSAPPQQRGRRSAPGTNQQASYSMRSYHCSANVCFDGFNNVLMGDGSTQLVKNLRQGDLVWTPEGSAEVVCVIKTCIEDMCELVTLPSSLKLTPYHPIRIDGQWTFPCNVSPWKLEKCDAVYSFVLTKGHVMLIEGVECCSLAHGFADNDVINHPYFGTQKILDDLKEFQGWNAGLIVLEDNALRRSSETGLLTKIPVGAEIHVRS